MDRKNHGKIKNLLEKFKFKKGGYVMFDYIVVRNLDGDYMYIYGKCGNCGLKNNGDVLFTTKNEPLCPFCKADLNPANDDNEISFGESKSDQEEIPQEKIIKFMKEKCKQIARSNSKLNYEDVRMFIFTGRDEREIRDWDTYSAKQTVDQLLYNIVGIKLMNFDPEDHLICPHCVYYESDCNDCPFSICHNKCTIYNSDYKKLLKIQSTNSLANLVDFNKLQKSLMKPEKWIQVDLICPNCEPGTYQIRMSSDNPHPHCDECYTALNYKY